MLRWYPLLGIVMFFATALGSAEPKTISAVYAHNTLSFTVPYEAAHSGEAEFRLEVLNPEDHVIGQAEHKTHVAEGTGVWKAAVELREPMPLSELVWHRVRFTLSYENQTEPDVEDMRCASPKLYLRGKVLPKIQPGEEKSGGRPGRNGRGSIRSQLSRRGLAPTAAATQ